MLKMEIHQKVDAVDITPLFESSSVGLEIYKDSNVYLKVFFGLKSLN